MTASGIFLSSCCISNSLHMGILYKFYFGRLRLLRSSDVEEKPETLVSRRSRGVVYTNILGLHKNLSDLSLTAGGGDVFFILRLLSLPGSTFPSSYSSGFW